MWKYRWCRIKDMLLPTKKKSTGKIDDRRYGDPEPSIYDTRGILLI